MSATPPPCQFFEYVEPDRSSQRYFLDDPELEELMLKEMLGVREGILADLHHDREEVSSLLARILDAKDNHERGELFREMMNKLLAHAKAEQKVLYRKLEKSQDDDARKFAFEGEVEHEVVETQLHELARARNKESEQWTARDDVSAGGS
jgi:hypothetical protein